MMNAITASVDCFRKQQRSCRKMWLVSVFIMNWLLSDVSIKNPNGGLNTVPWLLNLQAPKAHTIHRFVFTFLLPPNAPTLPGGWVDSPHEKWGSPYKEIFWNAQTDSVYQWSYGVKWKHFNTGRTSVLLATTNCVQDLQELRHAWLTQVALLFALY